MKVIVACEFSGVVRDAFRAHGHDAVSCDLLPTERDGPHVIADIRSLLTDRCAIARLTRGQGFDLMVAHPPCRYLAVSGARWFKDRQPEQREALELVRFLWGADILRIALENPISVISSHIAKPSQITQPWHFGHGEVKATCWWLKNLPLLIPTEIVAGRVARVHRAPPSPDRWKNRSRTLPGVAAAMAAQWGMAA